MRPEDISFLQIGELWPPPVEETRLERYANNKKLFKGEHDEVYTDWIRLLRETQQAILELIVNFPGAVTRLYTDLLFGELPRFTAAEQEWLDEFIARSNLHQRNYTAGLAQSYRGEAIYKVRTVEGKSVTEVIPASLWFPVTNPDNVTEILGHVLAWKITNNDDEKEKQYLRAEIHFPGWIHNRLYELKNGKIDGEVELSTLYSEPPEYDEETGVDYPLVVNIPNLELDDSVYGQDDYSEADTLFQELDVRLAQISRILDKHTDPNMYGPPLSDIDPETGEEKIKMGGRYFTVPEGSQPPGYLTWDAQLEANWKFLEQILNGLYIATDTNQAAFSLLAGGDFPSGAALKRLLMRTLARTNRKRLYFDSGLKRIIKIASQLEGKDVDAEIEWQDGLPQDMVEAATIEQIRTGNKPTSSVKSAIRRLDGGTDESIEEELAAIAEDEAQNALPSVPNQTQVNFGEV